MSNDLMLMSIQNYDIDEMDENVIESFNIMLKNNNFKKYHNVINSKIEEYKEFNKEEPVISTDVKVDHFYKTNNNSIVFVQDCKESKEFNKLFRVLIIKGGMDANDTKNIDNTLQVDIFGYVAGKDVGTFYVSTSDGSYMLKEKDKKFSMHIKEQINVDFKELGLTAKSTEIKEKQ